MTKAAELNALADRCEREEGSPSLNEAIERALHKGGPFPMTTPAYTTSLDAAVTLVPAGGIWRIGSPGWAVITGPFTTQIDGRNMSPPSPALALCAAALRARAALSQTEAEEGK